MLAEVLDLVVKVDISAMPAALISHARDARPDGFHFVVLQVLQVLQWVDFHILL